MVEKFDFMNKRLTKMIPILGLLILFLFIFWPVISGGTFLNTGVIYSDLWLFNYPLKDWYQELLVQGKLPFWTSLVGNGYPVFAEGQIGALYPAHLILFSLFPTMLAFNLNIFLHFFLSALFTYFFCRVSLKRTSAASFLAAIVYSLSGFFVTHIHQINILMVISYLPLVLLAIERIVSTKRILWAFVLALVFALQIFAGHIEMFYYVGLLGFGFFVLISLFTEGRGAGSGKRKYYASLLLIAAAVLGVGITVVQLLPTWELTKYSQRAEGLSLETASATTWPLETLKLFVDPDAYNLYRTEPGYHPLTSTTVNIMALYGYIGLVPLILALLPIVFWRKRFVVIFSILLFLSFLYGFGRSTQFFAILWETIPGLKFFRFPVKILFFIEFCLAILAAFGLDYLRKVLGEKVGKKEIVTAISLVLIVLAAVDLYANNIVRTREIIPAKEWLETPESAVFLQDELKDLDYRVYSHGTNNIDYQMTRKPEMNRQFRNILPVDFNVIYRIPENREWFVLFLERQTELNKQRTSLDPDSGTLGLSDSFKKSLALQNVRFLIADLAIKDPDLELVKEIPFSREVDHYAYFVGAEGPVTVIVPASATYIYEYNKAYPRALFVPKAKVVENASQALETVLSDDFDPNYEVVFEEEIEIEKGVRTGGGNAEIIKDEQDVVEVKVESVVPGFLVLADTFYPGWEAEVDGEKAQIYRANYAFRAVPVEEGNHTVTFSYTPTNWRLGVLISGVFLFITIGGLGYVLVRKK